MNAHSPSFASPAPSSMLASRAMLASFKVSVWSAKKYDREVTQETNTSQGADASAGRYNKSLLGKHAMAKVQNVATAARQFHNSIALPWLIDGTGILPSSLYSKYSQTMREHRVAFESAVDGFLAGYDSFVDEARVSLGRMFKESDYPSREDMWDKFAFRVRMLPMPDSADFRADLSDNQLEEVRRDIEESTKESLQLAMGDAWSRINVAVSKMVERLNAYRPARGKGDKSEGVFRDSLVENVRDLVSILPAFNLTNDAAFAAVVARMESDLCASDAESLREDPILRQSVADSAAEILASVSQYLA